MSIRLTARVWDLPDRELKEARLLVLLALADRANDDGEECYPSIPYLAERARISDRQTQRAIQWLEGRGYVEIVEKGNGRGRKTQYRLHIPDAKRVTLETEKGDIGDIKGDIGDAKRVTLETEKGDIGDIAYIEDPSNDPSIGDPEREGEAALAPPAPPPAKPRRVLKSPIPARQTISVHSPYLDAGRFNAAGVIPPGVGRNAVEVYYERFAITENAARLNRIQEDDLVRVCLDLDRLREVVVAYSQTGFRRGNLRLILDWYADPSRYQPPVRAAPAHAGGSPPTKVQASLDAVDYVFDRLRQEQSSHG